MFSVGFSNGGHLCYKVAFEHPKLFKGIGVYSANIPEETNNDCTPKKSPISTILINGTADPVNPHNGGLVVFNGDSSRGRVLSSINTFNYFKELLPDSCKNEETITNKYSDNVSTQEIECNTLNYQIKLITIKDGGHTIPLKSPPPYLPPSLGKTETSINSAKIILDFFNELL